MNPLISIIVPIYNSESTLNKCIDSIINQSFTDWELLLVNDGSSDSSGKICDEYAVKDPRVKVFHKENGGVSSARNVGIDNAMGKWITFCDSDDFVYSSWLDNFVTLLITDNELICQSFKSSESLFNPSSKGSVYGFDYCGNKCDGLIKLYENKILGYLWVKLFKKEVIDKFRLRFDERFNYWEDQIFCIKYLCYIDTMSCTRKVGYYYNVPDWDNKYRVKKNMILVHKLIYISFSDIFKGELNKLVSDSIDDYIGQVLDSYREKDSQCKSNLKELCKVMQSDILKSHLFFLTKWIVYLDRTFLFSHLLLFLHVKLKRGNIKN
ncbi:glycosyltransferase family 2 protein [Phocaeicola faecicola]|uniref:glycosyltransferase family 2 protein n=1 Tax=Phocaeicola faecicola TaxID=2739389 RepID=UPI0015E7DCFE|nr:glycosyltransferase family A protein [Phocaeicola faecicola]